MNNIVQEDQLYTIEQIDQDQHLQQLFAKVIIHPQPKTTNLHTNHSDQPSHYDPQDLEKDYLSDCGRVARPMKRNKKRKMITNVAMKIRRERKNKLYIELLENRIFELEKQIQTLTKNSQK